MKKKKKHPYEDFKIKDLRIKNFPRLLTYTGDEDYPTKNEPIFEFKDVLDYCRLFTYLKELPQEEQDRKVKEIKKIYPELDF